jgi:hypothetical protein
MQDLKLQVDSTLLEAALSGTEKGLRMTEITPTPVGVSRLVRAVHEISVIVGLVGRNSGSVSLNMSRPLMLLLSSRLLGEEQRDVSDDNLDAIMEIGNMVAGSIKESLSSTDYAVSEISLPSLVFGREYTVVYARGIMTAAAEFEIAEMPVLHMSDRFMTTSISLLRRSGSGK